MGSLIKRYRQAHGVTQRELAAAADLSIGTLRDLEQGRTRFPRWGMVERLAAVLALGHVQRAELIQAWRAVDGDTARQPAQRCRGLRIQILGPLAAWRDGTPLDLGSRRQRAVLALLAVRYPEGLHRNEIIDLLWRQDPPASAVPVVQGYVSRLRRLLDDGSAEAGITTVGGCCYRLNAAAGHVQLDLAMFRQATRAAQGARPDPPRACDLYEQALGTWRGDLLADVDLLRGLPAAVEVSRQHAETVLEYAEVAMLAGMPARVLPHLRRLCAADPLDEHAHARLMVVLAAAGQQAAALQVFTQLRTLLDAELGIAPSAVLARAQAAVLRQTHRPIVSFLSRTNFVVTVISQVSPGQAVRRQAGGRRQFRGHQGAQHPVHRVRGGLDRSAAPHSDDLPGHAGTPPPGAVGTHPPPGRRRPRGRAEDDRRDPRHLPATRRRR